ncbi:MAG: choice-of-anchor L domain-containing protein [Sulfurimonas sp.]
MKSFTKMFYFPLLIFALSTVDIFAFATYTSGSNASTLATQIQGVGITISNPTITHGAGTQVGVYSNGINGAGLEIDEGIILTGSTVVESFTTNSSGSISKQPSGQYTDTDLVAIDSSAVFNPVIFEFDVTLDTNTRLLLIDYQFASDEYNEYVGSRFNDAFGFFISGGDLPAGVVYNIARVVDNQTFVTISNIGNYLPVTVNNVNNGTLGIYDDATPENLTNSAFFIDNIALNNGGTSPVIVEYDGLTHILHATLDNLTPGQTYHFKMALADTGDAQWDTGVFVNKISGLREPSICYDYAYKQNGLFLTEGYDAAKGPFVSGDVTANDPTLPIEVAMYFQNTQDSEIVASNINLDIIDINTTQATYKTESVSVTETNSLTKIPVADVDLNVSNSYIKEIPVTSFDAFEYFYTYFSLDPKMQTLSLPIVARITYDLTIPLSANDNLTITRSSLIDTDVPICGGGLTEFLPVYGAFNIIENGLYIDATNYSYNLNTQVTNRDANLSLVSIDMNETSNPDLHTLKSITTVVGVDMLDLKSFHYTGAACSESGNSISDREWIILDNTFKTDLITNNVNFYKTARENVALRLSYNVDNNGSIIKLEKITDNGETRWNVLNFSNAVKTGECAVDIANGVDRVAQWCSNAGASFNSAMTKSELDICMECVYGLSTKLICARDNFSIRPEAFLMHIDDQDQNHSATPSQRLTTNASGLIVTTNPRLNLAAGYYYNLEVKATNHLDNTASVGYNFHLNTQSGTSSGYGWVPSDVTLDPTKCNDIVDHNFTTKFINGAAEMNTSINQVGDYTLSMLDTSWTSIDSVQQSHHTGNYFLNGSDCVLDSADVASVNAYDSNNGCNISSHPLIASDSNLVFNDYNITFHPYKFNVTNLLTIGMNDANSSFVYMSDFDKDENMSIHLNNTIIAQGYNGVKTTNFTDGCYAKELLLNVTKTPTKNTALVYRFRVHDLNSTQDLNGSILANNLDLNISKTFPKRFFNKALLGESRIRTNMNFDKDTNTSAVANPEQITYGFIKFNDLSNTFYADLNSNQTADGNQTIAKTINHYQGSTSAAKTTIVCDATSPCQSGANGEPDVLIYYEVYCDGNTSGNECNATIIPNYDTAIRRIPGWYTNTEHVEATFDKVTDINDTKVTVSVIDTDGAFYIINRVHSYNTTTNTLPYATYMKDTVPRWLIYNTTDSNASVNLHEIEYRGKIAWSGSHDSNTTTKTKYINRVNRRTMW